MRQGSSAVARREAPPTEVDEIRASIAATRDRIARSLDDISGEVHERLDWQGWVRENPWKAVGVAAAFGLYLGLR